ESHPSTHHRTSGRCRSGRLFRPKNGTKRRIPPPVQGRSPRVPVIGVYGGAVRRHVSVGHARGRPRATAPRIGGTTPPYVRRLCIVGGDRGRAVPSTANAKRLVIVESPAKAKTISGYLGPSYVVEASFGHVRDLPVGAKEMPEELKKKPWAYLGVDVENDFTPVYIISSDRRKQITRLRALLKNASELYLATDEDR